MQSNRKNASGTQGFIALTTILLSVCASVFLSESIADYTARGLKLTVNVIAPSVFIYLIIAEMLSGIIVIRGDGILGRAFEGLMHISGAGLPAYLIGLTCGFPAGAVNAERCYKNGKISFEEYTRLAAISNNASPAYVIGAIGSGLLLDIRQGVALLIINAFASAITGIIIGSKKRETRYSSINIGQRADFVACTKKAANGIIYMGAFITVFSVICGLLSDIIRCEIASAIILSILEIGNATLAISESCILPEMLSFALIAFSISFSGVCVIMQTLSFIDHNSLFSVKLVLYKLLHGAVSFLLAAIVYGIFFT